MFKILYEFEKFIDLTRCQPNFEYNCYDRHNHCNINKIYQFGSDYTLILFKDIQASFIHLSNEQCDIFRPFVCLFLSVIYVGIRS